jgi:hypothetical protein
MCEFHTVFLQVLTALSVSPRDNKEGHCNSNKDEVSHWRFSCPQNKLRTL